MDKRNTVVIPQESNWSIKGGTWFVFKNEKFFIAIHGASSGTETIYIDGEIASQKRSIKRQSSHEITHEKLGQIEVDFNTTNLLKAEMTVEIKINGQLVKVFETKYQSPKIKYFLKRFLISIGISIPLAVIGTIIKLNQTVMLIFMMLLVMMSYKWRSKKGKGELLIFEK